MAAMDGVLMAAKRGDKQWQTPLAQGALRPQPQPDRTFPAAPPDQAETDVVETAVAAEEIDITEKEETAVTEPAAMALAAADENENTVFVETDSETELADETATADEEPILTTAETAAMTAVSRPCLAEFVAYETAVVTGVAILGTTLYAWLAPPGGLTAVLRIGLIGSSVLALGLIAATFTVFAGCKRRSKV